MNFKKYKLDFKGRPQRSPKTISNYNLFQRFQPWCWAAIQKLNSKDQVFLKRCYAKESSNLIAQVNCGAQAFLWKGVGGSPPSSSVKKKSVIFVQKLTIYDHESFLHAENIHSLPPEFWKSLPPAMWWGKCPYWPDPNGKLSDLGCIVLEIKSIHIHMKKS